MRIALLSDVHGNLPALRSVLEDVDTTTVDQIWCLGDLVGYGAEPDGCVALARERCDLVLAGNHDLVVTGAISINDFSPNAAEAALWTRKHISAESLEFLSGLAPAAYGREIGLFHGSPHNPIWEYVLAEWQADASMQAIEQRIGAVGHSHVALSFRRNGDGRVVRSQPPGGTELDVSTGEWLLNPGGAGQPRDGDKRAPWLLLDTNKWTAEWRRVEYPIEEAARAIEEAGLPSDLAKRLSRGE